VFGVNEALWRVEWVSSVGRSNSDRSERAILWRVCGLGEGSTRKLVFPIARLRQGGDGIFG
jgi:hypothetical protein